MPCPYLSGEYCKLYDSHQGVSQRHTFCLSGDNYTRCANWKPSSSAGVACCPYFTGEYCKIYNTYQEGYQKQTYCLSVANRTKCPDFR